MLVRQSDRPNANNSSAGRESPRKERRTKRVAGGRQSDRLTGKADDTCAVKADNTRNASRPALSTKIPNTRPDYSKTKLFLNAAL